MDGQDKKEMLRTHIRWVGALLRSMEVALHSEDPSNQWKHGGYKKYAQKYNDLLSEIGKHHVLPPILRVFSLDKIKGGGDTLPFEQKEIFESVHAEASVLKAVLESELGVVEDQREALRDFLQARLRSAMLHGPDNERDVQDAIEQLFIGRGLQKGADYDREVGRVKLSTKESVPDFILPRLGLALEAKLVKTAARVREVVDEIAADIVAYGKEYRQLLFVVYDLGCVRDEVEFRSDLEAHGNVVILVVKH